MYKLDLPEEKDSAVLKIKTQFFIASITASLNPLQTTLTSLFDKQQSYKNFQVIHKRKKKSISTQHHHQQSKEYQCRRQKLISCCLGKLRSLSLSQAFKSRDPSIQRVMISLCLKKTEMVSTVSNHAGILIYIVKATERRKCC